MKWINKKIVTLLFCMVLLSVCGFFLLPTVKCKIEGGEYNKVGISGGRICVIQYDDAGKECQNSTECRGKCIFNGGYDLGNRESSYYKWAMSYQPGDTLKVSGVCEVNNNPFDCSTEVTDGYIQSPLLCVD